MSDHIQEPPIGPPEHPMFDCAECQREFYDNELDDEGLCETCRWPVDCDHCELERCYTECVNQGGK